jgi:hypothetical protein
LKVEGNSWAVLQQLSILWRWSIVGIGLLTG